MAQKHIGKILGAGCIAGVIYNICGQLHMPTHETILTVVLAFVGVAVIAYRD